MMWSRLRRKNCSLLIACCFQSISIVFSFCLPHNRGTTFLHSGEYGSFLILLKHPSLDQATAKIFTGCFFPLTDVVGSCWSPAVIRSTSVRRARVASDMIISVPISLVNDWSRDAKLTVSPTRRYDNRLGLPILAAKASPVWMPMPCCRIGQLFSPNSLLSFSNWRHKQK